MGIFSRIVILIALAVSTQALATQVVVTKNIRGDARYYVRYDEISQKSANRVGVQHIPGTADDEGYCLISGFLNNQNGFKRADLKVGDILELVGEDKWTLKVFSYSDNNVVDVNHTQSKLVRKSDGTEFHIGCAVDTSASNTAAYQPIANVYTKAYLTILGIFVN